MLKNQVVVFHPPQRKLPANFELFIFNHKLRWEYFIKYLGILIDSNLTWRNQINNIVKNVKRNKVSEAFSDRKFYLKHKLSTASLQSTGKVIINYSTDIATGQWFTITTIMACNITMISFTYVNSQ